VLADGLDQSPDHASCLAEPFHFSRPPDDKQVGQFATALRHPFAALYNGSRTRAKPEPALYDDSQCWQG
jgi:hypothetical protein